jgi:uncharacterized protein YceK
MLRSKAFKNKRVNDELILARPSCQLTARQVNEPLSWGFAALPHNTAIAQSARILLQLQLDIPLSFLRDLLLIPRGIHAKKSNYLHESR